MQDIELKTKCKSGDIHKVEVSFYRGTIAITRKVLTSDYELVKFFDHHRKFGSKYYVSLPISLAYREVFAIIKFIITRPLRIRKFIKSK